MTTIYRVSSPERLHHSDPLHVGRFYPHTERVHPHLMRNRQDLILYLASIHSAAVKSCQPLGFCRIPMRLMTLRKWVYDYKRVFDHFFEVVQEGYNLGPDNFEISIVIPRRLEVDEVFGPIHRRVLVYIPPPLPATGVVSKVFVQQQNEEAILARLAQTGRLDLHAPVKWLLTQPSNEFNFYFTPAGKLQLRDTSTWPVAAVETWPSWLREGLFGGGIDIESAYIQFLIEHIREAYKGREAILASLYPDLLRSLDDKTKWRRELCEDILGLEWNDENAALVKKICMSLANGSRISPAILNGFSSFSVTRDLVLNEVANTSVGNLARIGERLSRISKQYLAARKVVCTMEMSRSPTRKNQKEVFVSYFHWERKARYAIWEKIGRHGVMVHDGIDGVPEEYLKDIPGLVRSLNLRLT